MTTTDDTLVRQHYLIPGRLVRKVQRLAQRERLPAAEIVRRALESYSGEPAGSATEAEVADRLLAESSALLEQVSGRVERLNARLDAVRAAITDGSVRREAAAEMQRWIADHPEAVRAFREFLEPGATRAAGDAAGNSAPAPGAGRR